MFLRVCLGWFGNLVRVCSTVFLSVCVCVCTKYPWLVGFCFLDGGGVLSNYYGYPIMDNSIFSTYLNPHFWLSVHRTDIYLT